MKKFFGAHVSEHPRLTTVQHFAEDQRIEKLRPFLQRYALVVVQDSPVRVKSSMCQCYSTLHFNSMISFVMQDTSQVLILSYYCNMANLLFADNGHGARSCWAEYLLLALADSATSEREEELSFAFLQIGGEAIPFHGVQEQGCGCAHTSQ